jgi:predicted aconitase
MDNLSNLKIKLTPEEKDILRGAQDPVMQKIMKTVVLYGEALNAESLVDIEGDGHFVICYAIPGIGPSMEMLHELVDSGLKTKFPFTLDPKAPLDFENLILKPEQERMLSEMYKNQAQYEQMMLQLGLRDKDAFTCNPYLPEVGNIPKRNTILAWSESACVIFANSALGARSNRHGAIMELLCNIAGKTPLTGLLTDEGRRATWLVKVKTSCRPFPALLGAAIGRKVMADVPFIVGLDRFLGPGLNEETMDYLHEMGAACATFGAVGLYHVKNITPEAVDYGRDLLVQDYETFVIDDQILKDLEDSYPILWADKQAKPEKCLIGCPHLSLRQIYWWAENIQKALDAKGKNHLAVPTVICSATEVLQKFQTDTETYEQLKHAGVRFSATCSLALFDNDLSAGEAIVTNSNKLRAYSTARFFKDEELVEIMVSGEM